MDRLFSLDNRLMMCASFVRNGARLADIGTDHAYLPVWLLKKGLISYAIASDINDGPLQAGKATADKYHAFDVDFRLGSGLETLKESDNITDIVIAGMGGELIADLLNVSNLVKDPKINLILQPMTKSEELIRYLYENGFEIKKQKCTVSSNKCYTIILAKYTGQCENFQVDFCYTGKLDLREEHSLRFLNQHIHNLENKAKGNSDYIPILNKLKESI